MLMLPAAISFLLVSMYACRQQGHSWASVVVLSQLVMHLWWKTCSQLPVAELATESACSNSIKQIAQVLSCAKSIMDSSGKYAMTSTVDDFKMDWNMRGQSERKRAGRRFKRLTPSGSVRISTFLLIEVFAVEPPLSSSGWTCVELISCSRDLAPVSRWWYLFSILRTNLMTK